MRTDPRTDAGAFTYRPSYGRRIPDLTGGVCVGNPGFTDLPVVEQYRGCIRCPVSALCPAVTPWPKADCCRQGHDKDTYKNGRCRACQSEDKRFEWAARRSA